MSSKIDSLIAEFAANLRAAIAEEAAQAFAQVAGGRIATTARAPRVAKAGAKRGSSARDDGKRHRRSPQDLEKQSGAILAFVKKNPGTRAELIGKSVGLSTLEMQIPIGQLLAGGQLKKNGVRRGTTYTAK